MDLLVLSLLALFNNLGYSLAVASSTFALTFFFMATRDGTVDASERRFMHAVYAVLRIGMGIIIITEIMLALFLYQASGGQVFYLDSGGFWFVWTALSIILGNALLMHHKKMPMWLGPAIAGGSWYALFVVHNLPAGTASYATLIGGYLAGIGFMVALLALIARLYPKQQPAS